MKQFLKDASTATMVAIVAGVLAIAVFLVVGLVGVYGYGWFTDHTANRQGETQKKHLIEGNGQYRIAAYDHFYDLCATIQTDETQIKQFKHVLATTNDPVTKDTNEANLNASVIKRSSDINDYNADARKSATEGQFRASDLPFRIDPNQENTTCHA